MPLLKPSELNVTLWSRLIMLMKSIILMPLISSLGASTKVLEVSVMEKEPSPPISPNSMNNIMTKSKLLNKDTGVLKIPDKWPEATAKIILTVGKSEQHEGGS
jgi:hypothetical protein